QAAGLLGDPAKRGCRLGAELHQEGGSGGGVQQLTDFQVLERGGPAGGAVRGSRRPAFHQRGPSAIRDKGRYRTANGLHKATRRRRGLKLFCASGREASSPYPPP